MSFLFKDEEFQDADFDVTAFVLKYQSVISLESLQQELKKYLESIRNRLYETVNRDYRDFIQIAMRLEGADVRLSLMQTPLLSLRSELNGLYDGLFSTLQAIQASVQSKQSFQERKAFLQLAVDCDTKLDAIESSMLIPSTSTTVQKATYPSSSEDFSAGSTAQKKGTGRTALYSRLCVIRNRDSPSQDEFDIYHCSEIERNAFDIAHFESLLSNLQLNTEESSAPAGCGYLDSIRTSLIEKIQSTRGKLLTRVKDRLSEMALNGVTSPFISTVSSPSPLSTALPLPFSHRSLTHLLRALLVLGEGVSFEMIIAEKVVHPLIRSVLTQSAIDGSLGGGSFSGLRDAMSALMHNIASRIENIAATCETELRGKPPIDIILRSVWLPVMTFLDQRYGALLFASAIADTFHACYDAIHHFTKTSAGLAGEAQRFFVYKRLLRSDEVRSFQERWKVDLYMQVEFSFVGKRVDSNAIFVLGARAGDIR